MEQYLVDLVNEYEIKDILTENRTIDGATAAFKELLIKRRAKQREEELAWARDDLANHLVEYIDKLLLFNGEEELELDEYNEWIKDVSNALANFEKSENLNDIFIEWGKNLAENAKSEEICPVKKDEEKEDFSTDDFVAWLEENNLL